MQDDPEGAGCHRCHRRRKDRPSVPPQYTFVQGTKEYI